MKNLVSVLVIIIAFGIGWFIGEREGSEAGARQMARHILNPAFNTDSFVAIAAEESGRQDLYQTSDYVWRGDVSSLAKLLCEQEGIIYDISVPTMGYKLVCPKCVSGGALYQQESVGSMYYGFHHVSSLESLPADEAVDMSEIYFSQTYCGKCKYPLGTDWDIRELKPLSIIVDSGDDFTIDDCTFEVDPNIFTTDITITIR